MSSGGGGDRAADIAEWEQRLEDAVMDNDINAINAAVKKLDKLQGKDAGRQGDAHRFRDMLLSLESLPSHASLLLEAAGHPTHADCTRGCP